MLDTKHLFHTLRAHLGNAQLWLALTPNSIAAFSCRGWRQRRQLQMLAQWQAGADDPATSLALLGQQLTQMLEALPDSARATKIVLSDAWARYFLVTPAANTQSLADCEAAAAMRLAALYGDAPQQWQISAQWHASQSFLAAALPQALCSMLLDVCSAHGHTVVAITPQWVANWNQVHQHIASDGWLAQFDVQQVQIAVLAAGQISALHVCQLPPDFWQQPEQLLPFLQREALRLSVPMPEKLQLLGRFAQPGWAQLQQIHCQHLGTHGAHGSKLPPQPGELAARETALELVRGHLV